MPTYEYACTACGHHLEVAQSMADAPLVECARCGGRLRKVFSPIGVVFKGSGFYRTDSRAKPSGGAGDSKPDTKPDTKPAAASSGTDKASKPAKRDSDAKSA